MGAMNTFRRIAPLGLAVCFAFGGYLGPAATPAAAFSNYPSAPSELFGGPGSGNGDFSGPAGVAIDESSGDVYVVDKGNNRVEKFNAEGSYLSQFNGHENPSFPGGLSSPTNVAVDNSTSSPSKGDVYVLDGGHDTVDKFSATGAFIYELKGFAERLIGVAVDPAGNVWVDEKNGRVLEFSGAVENKVLTSLELPAEYEMSGGLAVDSEDNLYVGRTHLTSEYFLEYFAVEFSDTGQLLGEDKCCSATRQVLEPLTLVIEPATNRLFLDEETAISQYGPFGQPYGSSLQTFGSKITSSSGIAVNGTTHTVYVSEGSTDVVAIFPAGPVLPDVLTGATSNVQKTSTKLEGVVYPDGKEVTECAFEYGTSTAYGQTATCAPAAPFSGSGPVTVSAQVSTTAGTTYDYRLVAGDANGSRQGINQTFTALPAVSEVKTNAADNVEVSGGRVVATLNGSLSTEGIDTHYYYEYGETEAYGSKTTEENAGEVTGVHSLPVQVVGLSSYEIYHFRLVASNSFGTTRGPDQTFSTFGIAPPVAIGLEPATEVAQFSATLNAKLETSSQFVDYYFEYGPTTAYGSIAPIPDSYAPVTTEPIAASQPVYGLQAGTTYHYRLVASSPGGTGIVGPDETFTTTSVPAPTAVTGTPEEIGVGSAVVKGTVDPHGWETTYLFEYGTSTAYGSDWPTIPIPMGALEGAQPVIVTIPKLLPSTTYHYRLVAVNGGGTSYGADMTFTTGEYPAPQIQEPMVTRTIFVPSIEQVAQQLSSNEGTKTKKSKKKGKKSGKKGKKGGKKGKRTTKGSKKGKKG
jgi:hypothetical protein